MMRTANLEEDMQERYDEKFALLEQDVETLLTHKEKQIKDFADQNIERVKKYDKLLMLLRQFCFWVEATVICQQERIVVANRVNQEDELAQLVAMQTATRQKIVGHMGER